MVCTACDIQKHWTAVSTLLSLIGSVYHDFPPLEIEPVTTECKAKTLLLSHFAYKHYQINYTHTHTHIYIYIYIYKQNFILNNPQPPIKISLISHLIVFTGLWDLVYICLGHLILHVIMIVASLNPLHFGIKNTQIAWLYKPNSGCNNQFNCSLTLPGITGKVWYSSFLGKKENVLN